jgi:hypothetical protein
VDDGIRDLSLSGEPRHAPWKLSGLVFYVAFGALCLWIFSYISGLYPYLGTGGDDSRSAPGTSTSIGKYDFGLGTMLLFKGQTGFIEYDSTSPEGEITLDVKPLATLGYSDAMLRVKGEASGTFEVPIESTGFYSFEHEPALGGGYGRTAYTVRWGAR